MRNLKKLLLITKNNTEDTLVNIWIFRLILFYFQNFINKRNIIIFTLDFSIRNAGKVSTYYNDGFIDLFNDKRVFFKSTSQKPNTFDVVDICSNSIFKKSVHKSAKKCFSSSFGFHP